jgi:hypothetical protein
VALAAFPKTSFLETSSQNTPVRMMLQNIDRGLKTVKEEAEPFKPKVQKELLI